MGQVKPAHRWTLVFICTSPGFLNTALNAVFRKSADARGLVSCEHLVAYEAKTLCFNTARFYTLPTSSLLHVAYHLIYHLHSWHFHSFYISLLGKIKKGTF